MSDAATGNGVSACIVMALSLTGRVHGRELAESLQLVIEYRPAAPVRPGSPTKAYASTLRLAFRLLLGDRPLRPPAHDRRPCRCRIYEKQR